MTRSIVAPEHVEKGDQKQSGHPGCIGAGEDVILLYTIQAVYNDKECTW
jgi:hypothetical protein